jgi:hypothetical protein
MPFLFPITSDVPERSKPSSRPCFHHNQAWHDFIDSANSPASSPNPLRPCRHVTMDDLLHRAAAPRGAIKGGTPLSIPSQHSPLLSSLTLLDISHHSPPISSSEPVEPPQKLPELGATPGDAACTWSLVVLDNAAAEPRRRSPHRW